MQTLNPDRGPPTVPLHTALYVRVSSRTQGEESQLPELKRYANGVEGPVVWYRDTFTGTTMERPEWRKLERAIAAGEVLRVVVWRLDRFGRTAKGLTALFADLVERQVGMVSMREGIDLSTPAGRMMANVIASVAQYETEVRSERQTAGIAAAKDRGVKFGRPPGEGGVPGKRVKVTPEQEEQIRSLKASGRAVAAIARATGLSRPTVYSVLAEPS
jgi:DNA invertase Pin-like site-specific DNA recombinase